jgi:hypothetical protein
MSGSWQSLKRVIHQILRKILDSRGSSRILMDLQTRRNTIPMMMASKSIIQVVEAKNILLQYNTLNSIANETEVF